MIYDMGFANETDSALRAGEFEIYLEFGAWALGISEHFIIRASSFEFP
jgi:hypothetical protein